MYYLLNSYYFPNLKGGFQATRKASTFIKKQKDYFAKALTSIRDHLKQNQSSNQDEAITERKREGKLLSNIMIAGFLRILLVRRIAYLILQFRSS